MKKQVSLLLIICVCLCCCACGNTRPSYTDYTGYLSGQQTSAQGQSYGAGPSDFSNAVTVISTPVPTPAPTPAPTPVPTPIPTPVPTPAPILTPDPAAAPSEPAAVPDASVTPSPAPTPSPAGNLVTITKSPTSETVAVGGSAKFIAYAENYTSMVWITVSPDKQTSYEIGDAPAHFDGLAVSGQGTSALYLSNIPASMDGWRIQAYFNGNGGPAYTAGAYLTVTGASAADGTETYVVELAKNAYNDMYVHGSTNGFSVGSLANYSYSNGVASYAVTFSSALYKVVAEFQSWYYSESNYGSGPVQATVYDAAGSVVEYRRLTDQNLSGFYAFLDSYK